MALVEHSADGICECVHGGGVDGSQSEASIHGTEQHRLACLHVIAVADGTLQVARYEPDALKGVHVDTWMGVYVGVYLYAVGQSVHACLCCYAWRHGACQLWVEVCGVAEQMV